MNKDHLKILANSIFGIAEVMGVSVNDVCDSLEGNILSEENITQIHIYIANS